MRDTRKIGGAGKRKNEGIDFLPFFFSIIQRTRLSRSLEQAKNISATRFTYGTQKSLIYDLLFMYYITPTSIFQLRNALMCGKFHTNHAKQKCSEILKSMVFVINFPFLRLVRSLTILDSRSCFPKY